MPDANADHVHELERQAERERRRAVDARHDGLPALADHCDYRAAELERQARASRVGTKGMKS